MGFAPATVLGVSFTGEMAYEIHAPNAALNGAYFALKDSGRTRGVKLFGARAVEAMRMEMDFMHWKADILAEFDPSKPGLDRFAKLDIGGSSAARRGCGVATVGLVASW